jgi:antirestriction protein ArdC
MAWKSKAKDQDTEKKEPYQDRLAAELLARMEAGTAPWQKGFTGSYEMPMNFTTGAEYRGGNVLKLACEGVTKAATFSQIVDYAKKQEAAGVPKEQCIHVRKGSKGHEICKVLTVDVPKGKGKAEGAEEKADDKDHKRPITKSYYVFNIDDCDNVPAELRGITEPEEKRVKGMQFADDIVEGMKATGLKFVESGSQPCYIPSLDEIRMPPRHLYKDDAAHAADSLHEAAHATMHESRKNRPEARGNKFGDEAYAMEELRAEVSAFFVACRTGFKPSDQHVESHAAYTSHWLKKLGDDKREFTKAVGDAREISDYLIERGQEHQKVREAKAEQSKQPVKLSEAETVASVLAHEQAQRARKPQQGAAMSM